MPWNYLYETATGRLVSETEAPVDTAELAAKGLSVKVLPERLNHDVHEWDETTKDVKARPKKIRLTYAGFLGFLTRQGQRKWMTAVKTDAEAELWRDRLLAGNRLVMTEAEVTEFLDLLESKNVLTPARRAAFNGFF